MTCHTWRRPTWPIQKTAHGNDGCPWCSRRQPLAPHSMDASTKTPQIQLRAWGWSCGRLQRRSKAHHSSLWFGRPACGGAPPEAPRWPSLSWGACASTSSKGHCRGRPGVAAWGVWCPTTCPGCWALSPSPAPWRDVGPHTCWWRPIPLSCPGGQPDWWGHSIARLDTSCSPPCSRLSGQCALPHKLCMLVSKSQCHWPTLTLVPNCRTFRALQRRNDSCWTSSCVTPMPSHAMTWTLATQTESFTACGPPMTSQWPRHTAPSCPETSMRSSHTYKTSWQKGWWHPATVPMLRQSSLFARKMGALDSVPTIDTWTARRSRTLTHCHALRRASMHWQGQSTLQPLTLPVGITRLLWTPKIRTRQPSQHYSASLSIQECHLVWLDTLLHSSDWEWGHVRLPLQFPPVLPRSSADLIRILWQPSQTSWEGLDDLWHWLKAESREVSAAAARSQLPWTHHLSQGGELPGREDGSSPEVASSSHHQRALVLPGLRRVLPLLCQKLCPSCRSPAMASQLQCQGKQQVPAPIGGLWKEEHQKAFNNWRWPSPVLKYWSLLTSPSPSSWKLMPAKEDLEPSWARSNQMGPSGWWLMQASAFVPQTAMRPTTAVLSWRCWRWSGQWWESSEATCLVPSLRCWLTITH